MSQSVLIVGAFVTNSVVSTELRINPCFLERRITGRISKRTADKTDFKLLMKQEESLQTLESAA